MVSADHSSNIDKNKVTEKAHRMVAFWIELTETYQRRLKDVHAQKFPRTDFFKTLTAGRK